MTDNSVPFVVTILVLGFAFLALVVWWALRAERFKAEMAHTERRLALERGLVLPDAEMARCRALGWIGVCVPLVSLGVAAGVTFLLVPPRVSEPSVGALVAVWLACGVTAASVGLATAARLRTPSRHDGAAFTDPPHRA